MGYGGSHTGSVLIASDDDRHVQVFRMLLDPFFHIETCVPTLKAVFKRLGQREIDLMILDISTSTPSITRFLTAIARIDPGVQIVLLTSDESDEQAVQGFLAGTTAHVTYPFEASGFITMLQDLRDAGGRAPPQ